MAPSNPADRPDSVTRGMVRRVQAGQSSEFAGLYERLAPALFGWASLRIPPELRSRLDPEDVLQDVWVRALGAFGSYDPDRGPFRPWIFRVAKHTLLDAFRRARVRARVRCLPGDAGADSAARQRLSQVPDDATTISRRVAQDESVARFLHRLQRLGADDLSLIVHCGLEGMPAVKAAVQLGLTPAAVQKRWQRLRARLARTPCPAGMID